MKACPSTMQGIPTSTFFPSKEGGQRDTFISSRFQLIPSTGSLGSHMQEMHSFCYMLTPKSSPPSTNFLGPTSYFLCGLGSSLTVFLSVLFNTVTIYRNLLTSRFFNLVLLSLQHLFCAHLYSFIYTQPNKDPSITFHSLRHFFPPTIISNRSSPSSQFSFFQFNLHTMVQGFRENRI